MGVLPIPASLYFEDFAVDLIEYNVLDNHTVVGTYKGLSNTDEEGNRVGFLMKDHPQISIGNTIATVDGLETFEVRRISYDRYNGKPELLKAYY